MIAETLSFMDAVKYENKLWCSNLNFNGLFALQIDGYGIEYIGRFEEYDKTEVGLHRIAKVFGDCLYFFPNYSNSIDSYNISSRKFSSCKIDSWTKNKGKYFTSVSGVFLWKDQFILIPRFSKMNLIKYSPVRNQIVDEEELRLSNEFCMKDGNMCFNCVSIGEKILIPIFGTNIVIVYDMESSEERMVVLPRISKITGAIGTDGKTVWINADEKIYGFDFSLNDIVGIVNTDKKEGIITYIEVNSDRVIALPAIYGPIREIDIKRNKSREIKVDVSGNELKIGPLSKWRHTERLINIGEKMLVPPLGINCSIVIDQSLKILDKRIITVPFESVPSDDFRSLVFEKDSDSLKWFISYINK